MPRAREATARQPPPPAGEAPVTVLVTGFGPFLEKYPRNSSWEIASTLPALLPATSTSPTPIHIHVYHEPVRVAYNTVLSLIPSLLPPANPIYPKPDIILHIGLAAGRTFYTLEQGSHRHGYGKIPDVDGERFHDGQGDKEFPEDVFPPALRTSFDTSDVLGRWRENLRCAMADANLPDVSISPDAGNFMCGFIYYNSLAHYFSLKEDERPVAFLHVPDVSGSEDKLAVGRHVATALIRALVDSRRQLGVVHRCAGAPSHLGERVAAGTDVNFA